MWGRSLCPPLRHPLALEGKGRSSTQPAFISSSPLSLPPPPLAPSPPPLSSGWGGCACGVCVCSPGAQFFKGFHGFRFRFKHLHLSSFLFLVACVQFFLWSFLFVCLFGLERISLLLFRESMAHFNHVASLSLRISTGSFHHAVNAIPQDVCAVF